MRILGIDLGSRRTGLAVSDPLGVSCSPLEIVEERDEERLVLRITEVARELDVGEMVVGLPRPLRGGTNAQLESVRAFVSALENRTAVRVLTWDERFTSKLALKDVKGRARGEPRDAVAACYMLQDYLDARAGDKEES